MQDSIKNPDLVKIGQNIRKYRLLAGISQEKLASLVKLHRNYIGALERGEENISIINLIKIGDTLGVSVAKLIVL